jgi:outer membrane lipoprotein-sorting protein
MARCTHILLLAALFVAGCFFAGAASAQEIEEDPVLLLKTTAERFDKIRTYTCKATSITKVYRGKKESTYQDVVQYTFQKPKHIKIKWLAPWNIKGQVAVFSDDQLKVHLNFLPLSIPIDPNGKVAQDAAGNRIYQTDMGTLIRQITDILKDDPQTIVSYEGTRQDKDRKVYKVSLHNKEGYVDVYIHTELILPVTVEYFSPEKKLLQAAYFEDLKVNVPMSPYEFIIE